MYFGWGVQNLIKYQPPPGGVMLLKTSREILTINVQYVILKKKKTINSSY